jgi:hypothetical protein
MQILYPIALAANIFSMQQDAIPFEQSPRSFIITVFALIIIVYITLLFSKYPIPPFARRIFPIWVKNHDNVGDISETVLVAEVGDAFQARKERDLRLTLGDEEQVLPKSLGTRALRGSTLR